DEQGHATPGEAQRLHQPSGVALGARLAAQPVEQIVEDSVAALRYEGVEEVRFGKQAVREKRAVAEDRFEQCPAVCGLDQRRRKRGELRVLCLPCALAPALQPDRRALGMARPGERPDVERVGEDLHFSPSWVCGTLPE